MSVVAYALLTYLATIAVSLAVAAIIVTINRLFSVPGGECVMTELFAQLFPGISSFFAMEPAAAAAGVIFIILGFLLAYFGFKGTLEPPIMAPRASPECRACRPPQSWPSTRSWRKIPLP